MKVSVYDTYVTRKDGKKMHFDILVPQTEKNIDSVIEFGKRYLASKAMLDCKLTTEESKFCHIENSVPKVNDDILAKGYSIVEMENC
jgi:hypothetical protein